MAASRALDDPSYVKGDAKEKLTAASSRQLGPRQITSRQPVEGLQPNGVRIGWWNEYVASRSSECLANGKLPDVSPVAGPAVCSASCDVKETSGATVAAPSTVPDGVKITPGLKEHVGVGKVDSTKDEWVVVRTQHETASDPYVLLVMTRRAVSLWNDAVWATATHLKQLRWGTQFELALVPFTVGTSGKEVITFVTQNFADAGRKWLEQGRSMMAYHPAGAGGVPDELAVELKRLFK